MHHTTTSPLHLLAAALLLALGGCSVGEPPDSRAELAARGAYSAALSPDAGLVAIGSLTHGASLWQVEPAERRFNWNHQSGTFTTVTALAFSPDGQFVLSAEGETLVLWSTTSGEALTFFNAPSKVLALALGPEGRYALLGLDDETAVLFDARQGGIKRVFRHEGRVLSAALDARGKVALTGSADHAARLWDVESGAQLQRWNHEGEVRLVALSPDGSHALSVSKYDKAALWDASSGLAIGEVPAYASRIVRGETVVAAAFSAEGSRLLTGTSDGRVQLWQASPIREIETWKMPHRSNGKRAGAYLLSVGFDAGNESFLGVSADGFIHRLRVPRPL